MREALEPFVGQLICFSHVNTTPIDYVVGTRSPTGFFAPQAIFVGYLSGLLHRKERHAQAKPVLSCITNGVIAPGADHHLWERLLHEARPNGHGSKLVIAALPGERFRFGESL